MRTPELKAFLDHSAGAMALLTEGDARTDAACARAIGLWKAVQGAPGRATPARLPVCDWIAPALDLAASGPRSGLAAAFAALLPHLVWKRRGSADPADLSFWNGHGNAMILGPGGLEERSDLWIGATVMAPGVTYADHDHPPEEVYLPLAPGEWWNAGMDWTDPGPQGAIYNPPGIRHRMRSGPGPFLALWYLPA